MAPDRRSDRRANRTERARTRQVAGAVWIALLLAAASLPLACHPTAGRDGPSRGPADRSAASVPAASTQEGGRGDTPASPLGSARIIVVEPDGPIDAQDAGPGVGAKGPPPPVPSSGSLGRLAAALVGIDGPVTLDLKPGHYDLSPAPYQDPSCGNCEDPAQAVPATRALRVSGRGIRIVGRSPDRTIIHTRAGYGILFEQCVDCSLEGVTITDGVRDPDGRATDAAVVIRESSVTLRGCRIRDNIGDAETVRKNVVGIIGIAGREGSDIRIEGCRIERNSWDGIALYRGARARIEETIVDGVDAASGGAVGGGRGVGIGLTWDAQATVRRNLVRSYWKGIGVFVNARAEISENVVEDLLTWGIACWDAGKGRPLAQITGNVIYRTGACGAMIAAGGGSGGERGATGGLLEGSGHASEEGGSLRSEAGSFVRNTLVRTGQNPRYDSGEPYCRQEALAEESVPGGFVIRDNTFFDNREPGGKPGRRDLDRSRFDPGASMPPGSRTARSSRFAADYAIVLPLHQRFNDQ